MTQPVSPDKPAGEAIPFGVDDGQNIAAKVKICRTPPPSALDEVVDLIDRATAVKDGWTLEARDDGEERYIITGDPCGFPVAKFGDHNDAALFLFARLHLRVLLTRLKDRGTD